MTGKEDIKVGDKLVCTSNDGLMCIGWEHTVIGITDTSINVVGCATCWQSRKSFRWSNYTHQPSKVLNQIPQN